jgi:hypothetical protein
MRFVSWQFCGVTEFGTDCSREADLYRNQSRKTSTQTTDEGYRAPYHVIQLFTYHGINTLVPRRELSFPSPLAAHSRLKKKDLRKR